MIVVVGEAYPEPDQVPEVLAALSPHYALLFIWNHPHVAFVSLGAIVLCVTGAEAQFAPRKTDAKDADARNAARPLFQPPQFPLVLPNARTRNGVGQTVKDLSEDPYAGADVTLTLSAKDEAGNQEPPQTLVVQLTEPPPSCTEISLNDFNLFLTGDYTGGHDVEGKVAVGGNITM